MILASFSGPRGLVKACARLKEGRMCTSRQRPCEIWYDTSYTAELNKMLSSEVFFILFLQESMSSLKRTRCIHIGVNMVYTLFIGFYGAVL